MSSLEEKKIAIGWVITHFIYESKNAAIFWNAFLLIHLKLNYGTDSLP